MSVARRSPAPPAAAETLLRSTGVLSTAATARMESDLPWFAELSAEDRSWVGVIVQAGVRAFVEWYADADAARATTPRATTLAGSVFGAAPRALAGVISLQQTVDLVRLSIEVVEGCLDDLLDPVSAADVHAAVLRYGREVAFATAEVYARAAEVRGAWDARLEALVVDSVLRGEADEAVVSRASALGWTARDGVVVVVGAAPDSRSETDLFEAARRRARETGMDALCAVQGDRLVVVLGGVQDPAGDAARVADLFGPGPVTVGGVVDDLPHAHRSARAAISALRAAPGRPDAPRPVLADDLVVERVLAGDQDARARLLAEAYDPLVRQRSGLLETLVAYLEAGGSVEAAARAAFVHANTVRYRLRQVTEATGLSPSVPRDALALRVALVLGRQRDARRRAADVSAAPLPRASLTPDPDAAGPGGR